MCGGIRPEGGVTALKITILTDNEVPIGQPCQGEPAFSALVEGEQKILFDTGQSDLFLRNAQRLGLTLEDVDAVVISHGHDDHIGGLYYLMEHFKLRGITRRPTLVLHPWALAHRVLDGAATGTVLTQAALETYFDLVVTDQPYSLGKDLYFLGEIPRLYPFEHAPNRAMVPREEGWVPDTLPDDTALAYRSPAGVVVLTGCAHAGVCNTIRQAQAVTGENQIRDVVGGFHLLRPTAERMEQTLDFIQSVGVKEMHPCHCTSFPAKAALQSVCPIGAVGCGSVLEYP